jgi:hypothetical protein
MFFFLIFPLAIKKNTEHARHTIFSHLLVVTGLYGLSKASSLPGIYRPLSVVARRSLDNYGLIRDSVLNYDYGLIILFCKIQEILRDSSVKSRFEKHIAHT